jgi:preprotein translocase subunit SecG
MGEILLNILIVAACILLIGVVLIQDSKGGGLTSSFGSSNQILGVRRTTDFLEKATWAFAIAIIVLSLASAWVGGGSSAATSTSISKQQADQTTLPGAPQQQQQQGGQQQGGGQQQQQGGQQAPAKTN